MLATVKVVSRGLAIRLRGVVKRYGQITAVAGLDLDVPEGTCVGLLGPNGAGKTTTMKMLTAQAIADEGELEVLGHVLPGDSKAARAKCGVVPQLDNLDVTLTTEQNLLVFAHLYRIPRAERRAAIDWALDLANLRDRRDTRVDRLSGGMRRRLLIARALVHRPRLLLLDEPTVGLDPQVRQELWALIDNLRSEGTSILMSTHYIEEAQRLADTVTIMSHGSAVAVGPPAALVAEHAGARGGRGLRSAGAADRGRGRRARAGPAHAADGHQHRGARQRPRPRRRAPAGQPRGRLRACSPERRSRERSSGALGAERRARARGRQLLLVLEVHHLLLDGPADDLPDRLRLRLRLAGHDGRRLRLRAVRRHRHGGHRRALRERLPRHVRDLRQVPVPAHLRRDPRGAGRHRGARHGRGAVDRARARASTAACRCSWAWSSAWTPRGACSPCPSSASWPASAGARAGS